VVVKNVIEILSGYKRKHRNLMWIDSTPEAIDMDDKEQHQIVIRRRFAILMNSDVIEGLQNCERKC
jgi:hypothetical protein